MRLGCGQNLVAHTTDFALRRHARKPPFARIEFAIAVEVEALQQAGLVQVKAGVNPARISELDLAANPHKLKFVALEAAQLPRVLEDADFVVVNGNFAVSSGLKLSEAVVLEKTPDQYLNVVAVKTGNEKSQWAQDLAAAYKSPEFKTVVDSQFPGYAKPAFLK